ncbi:hypothetical protein ACP70R_005186 [Stipagrostis hirtigluma subsp. patula]
MSCESTMICVRRYGSDSVTTPLEKPTRLRVPLVPPAPARPTTGLPSPNPTRRARHFRHRSPPGAGHRPPASSDRALEELRVRQERAGIAAVEGFAGGAGELRTVPIAVTPEGFWCCPSPVALHMSLQNPHHHAGGGGRNNQPQLYKTLSAQPSEASSVQNAPSVTDESAPAVAEEQQNHAAPPAPAAGGQQEQQHKICIGFGRPETMT